MTQATVQEWALKNGLDANMSAMTQAEKAMLRYQYVMAQSEHITGDFARTNDTYHNTLTRLKANFATLKGTIGTSLMNLFKPIMVVVNNAIVVINKFAKAVGDSLGKILGWRYEVGSGAIAMDDVADSVDDVSSGLGSAGKAAKELKKQLQGFDELNNLSLDDNNGGGGSGGGGLSGLGGAASDLAGQWVKEDSLFESDWDTWFKLGRGISEAWTEGLNSINWAHVYAEASYIGTNFADFLNGLFTPELFGAVGETIAGSLNTAIYTALAFGEKLEWSQMGDSIASGINGFLSKFQFKATAETINVWSIGILDMLISAVEGVEWETLGEKITDFISTLKLGEIASKLSTLAQDIITGLAEAIGGVDWEEVGKKIGEVINNIEIGDLLLDLTELALEILKALGDAMKGLYESNPLAAALVTLLIGIKLSGGLLNPLASNIVSAISSGITGSSSTSLLSGAFGTLFRVGGAIFAVVATAIAGWNIGQMIYDQLPTDESGNNAIDRGVETVANYWLGNKTTSISDMGAVNNTFQNRYKSDILAGGGSIFDVMEMSTKYTEAYSQAMRGGSNEIDALNYALSQLTPELNKYGIEVDNNRKQTDNLSTADKKQQTEVTKLKKTSEDYAKTTKKSLVDLSKSGISSAKELFDSFRNQTNTTHSNSLTKFSEIKNSIVGNVTTSSDTSKTKFNEMATNAMTNSASILSTVKDKLSGAKNETTSNANSMSSNWSTNMSAMNSKTTTDTKAMKDTIDVWSRQSKQTVTDTKANATFGVNTPTQTDISSKLNNLKEKWTPKNTTFGVDTPTQTDITNKLNSLKQKWTPKDTKFGIETPTGTDVQNKWNQLSGFWKDKNSHFNLSFGADASSTSSVLSSVANAIYNAFSGSKLLSGIASAIRTKIRGYATGGVFDSPHIGLFGEAGTEAVVPLERNTQWLGKMAGMIVNEMAGLQYNPPSYSSDSYSDSTYYSASHNDNGYSSSNSDVVREQNALLREQNDLLRRIAEKDVSISSSDVFKAVKQENDDWVDRTGNSPFFM